MRTSAPTLLVVLAACGGDDAPPLPPPVFPHVVDEGGLVLTAPRVVPVFFAGDAMQTAIEGFLGQLAGSDYWTQTTAEYGVGPLSVGPSVVVTAPVPAMLSGSDVESFLRDHLDPAVPGWPALDAETIYVVFYQENVVISDPSSTSCVDYLAYHDQIRLAGTGSIVYALIPRCAGFGAETPLDVLTGSVAHELIEAATDPLIRTLPAWSSADIDHYAWSLATFGEIADMCALQPQTDQRLVGPYIVPRSWSNAAALARHDPCVPAPSDPYFAAVPVLEDSVIYDYGTGQLQTKGVRVPLHESRTIDVQLYADAPTTDWNVKVADDKKNGKSLTFEWDHLSGHAGDVLHLTITRMTNADNGGNQVVFSSYRQSSIVNFWFAFIAN